MHWIWRPLIKTEKYTKVLHKMDCSVFLLSWRYVCHVFKWLLPPISEQVGWWQCSNPQQGNNIFTVYCPPLTTARVPSLQIPDNNIILLSYYRNQSIERSAQTLMSYSPTIPHTHTHSLARPFVQSNTPSCPCIFYNTSRPNDWWVLDKYFPVAGSGCRLTVCLALDTAPAAAAVFGEVN